MKKIILFAFLLLSTSSYGQSILSSVNSGAHSTGNLLHAVGEIYVIPVTDMNQANSGIVGVVSRIEFFVTGNGGLELIDAINVFPNPTTNAVYVEGINLPIDLQFQLYDASGRLMSLLNCVNRKIDLTLFPAGVYILKTTNSIQSELKIIKQ